MGSILTWLGHAVVRHRWPVVLFWFVLVVAGATAARDLPSRLQGGGFEVPGSESARAAELIRREFPGESAHTLLVVMASPDVAVGRPEHRTAVEGLAGALAADPAVERVLTTYSTGDHRFVSMDRAVTYAVLQLRAADADAARDAVPAIRDRIAAAAPPDWLTVRVTGSPAVAYDMTRAAAEDLPQAERIGLPIALITLVVAFGALVAAGLPLVVGLIAITVTMGAAALIGERMELSSFVQNIVPMLGLGVGIDYCLLMVSRFREELARGLPPGEAAVRTVATAGQAVAFSGGTVAIGLSALFVPDLLILRSVAIGGVLVTVVAVAAALTLLPAVLALLGGRIDAPRSLTRLIRPDRGTSVWRSWATMVMRHPAVFTLAALIGLGLLAVPALRLTTLAPGATLLPEGTGSRDGLETLAAGFGAGEMSPLLMVADTGRSGGVFEDATVRELHGLVRIIESDARVRRVESIVAVRPGAGSEELSALLSRRDTQPASPVLAAVRRLVGADGRATLIRVVPSVDPESLAGRELVRDLRARAAEGGRQELGDVLVGGAAASSLDLEDELYRAFPIVVALVLTITFVVLLVVLGSVLLPLTAIAMNVLSVLAAYGVLVLVFQDGVGAAQLGFVPPGAVGSIMPVALFAILFGLSMDYEIFLLSRVREGYDATGDPRRGVVMGLEATGRIITSAALIMVAIFGSFALSRFVVMKELGVGMSVAVLLDATIIRIMLVPAVLSLLGSASWWVPFGRRRRTLA